MRFKSTFGLALLLATCVALVSCSDYSSPEGGNNSSGEGQAAADTSDDHVHPVALEVASEAVAVITPTEGNTAHGEVRFTESGGKINIVADIEGLKPDAKHAIHIHQFGDMRASDGTSLGGHYNPEGHPHAGPTTSVRHAGDLGNLSTDSDGKAHYELTVDNITINGDRNPILGYGMVIHGGEDDLTSQPTGAAGPRIGVGVIGVAKPAE